jgi:hypothetical protein
MPRVLSKPSISTSSWYGVELVDEHDAGLVAAGVLEEPPHAGRADAGIHLDEIGPAREQERHARFARDGTGEERLAGAWRADEEHALGDAAADRREPLRAAQEVDDFLDLVLGLVHARDVLERDDLVAALGELHAPGRVDAPGRSAVHREAEERDERDGDDERGPAQRPRLGRRHDVDLHTAARQIRRERAVGRQEARRQHRVRR